MKRLTYVLLAVLLSAGTEAQAASSFSGSRSSFSGSGSSGSMVPRSSFQRQAPVAVAPITTNRSPAASIDPGYTRRNTGPESSFKGDASRPTDGQSLYQRYQGNQGNQNRPGTMGTTNDVRRPAASYDETAKYRRQDGAYSGSSYNRPQPQQPYPQQPAQPQRRGGFSWGSAAAGAAAGFMISSLLNHTANAAGIEEYRQHYNDPSVKAWRDEQRAQAENDPELKRQFDELENRVQAAAPATASGTASQKQAPVARLCAGMPQGGYAMAANLLNRNIPMDVVQTSGSLENLDAVRTGRCDIGFAQRDVVVTETGQVLKTSSDFMLEALMLMCNTRDLPGSLGDMKSGSRIAIPTGTGAEATWKILAERLPRLKGSMLVEALTPSEAIALASSNQADCAFLVTHPDSGILGFADLDNHLRLVPILEQDFKPLTNTPEWANLYQPVSIAGRRFKHLASSSWVDGYAIETVLLVNDDWRQSHRSDYDRILRGVGVIRTRLEGQP